MNLESDQTKYQLDSHRWISILPSCSKEKGNREAKKYSIGIILFVFGLVLVSMIKNETRNLQKEITNLRNSINSIKFELYQARLDHDVIASPENISRLAKEHLESDFNYYKQSQIRHLNQKGKILTKLEKIKPKKNIMNKKKNKAAKREKKIQITKKIEINETELVKSQYTYSKPKNLPHDIKLRIVKKIETKKDELKKFYSDPYEIIKSKKAQQWMGLQVVKIFLGIPIVPGK